MTTNHTNPGEPRDDTSSSADEPLGADQDVLTLETERQRLENEAAQLKDRLIRTLADMENLRKRTEREITDAKTYAVTGFARDLLSVADNMDRALAALPAEGRDDALSAFAEGVELTSRELLKILQKHGIKRISPRGEKFDPHYHQAMFEVEDSTVPAGTVVQVVQDGYVLGERALRPAFVGVAKGGQKPQPAAASAAPTAASDPATASERPGVTIDRNV